MLAVHLACVVHRNNMFRRVITAILMYSVLGYATAWAFEWHAVDIAHHAAPTDHADWSSQSDAEDCDHCCHVGAHLIGFAQRGCPISPIGANHRRANRSAIFVTPSTEPP